jgi:putative membrane protein
MRAVRAGGTIDAYEVNVMAATSTLPRLNARLHEHAVPLACLCVFVAVWIALAIAPRHRKDWLLENLLTVIAVAALSLTYRRVRFSDRAYVQGTVFLILHTIGSHYTYSEVPFGAWVSELAGASRNHYDRIVHFSFGLLMVRPIRELAFLRRSDTSHLAQTVLALSAIGGMGAAYEVLEWLTAVVVDPESGQAFLGTQGDPWDAQKDMGLALLGGMIGGVLELLSIKRPNVGFAHS